MGAVERDAYEDQRDPSFGTSRAAQDTSTHANATNHIRRAFSNSRGHRPNFYPEGVEEEMRKSCVGITDLEAHHFRRRTIAVPPSTTQLPTRKAAIYIATVINAVRS